MAISHLGQVLHLLFVESKDEFTPQFIVFIKIVALQFNLKYFTQWSINRIQSVYSGSTQGFVIKHLERSKEHNKDAPACLVLLLLRAACLFYVQVEPYGA